MTVNTTLIFLAELYDEFYELLERFMEGGQKEEALRLLHRLRRVTGAHKERVATVMGLQQLAAGVTGKHPVIESKKANSDCDGEALGGPGGDGRQRASDQNEETGS